MTTKKRKGFKLVFLIVLLIIGLYLFGSVHQFFQDGYIMNTMLDYVFWCTLVSVFVAFVVWLFKRGRPQGKFIAAYCFLLVFMLLVVPEVVIRIAGTNQTYLEENGEWSYTSLSVFRSPTWTVKCSPNDKGRYRKTEYDQRWASNSLGYVDREWDKGATGIRIMALGDSFTEGLGGEHPWIKALSVMLKDDCDLHNYYFNGGISGHDPLLALQNLQMDLLSYRPDVVLLAVNSSDLDDILARGCFDRFIVTDDGDSMIVNTEQRKFEYVYAISHVTRGILRMLGYDWSLMTQDEKLQRYDWAKQCLSNAIEEYQRLANEKEFKFCVIFHPSIHNIERNDMSEFDLTKELLREQHIDYIDILSYYHDTLAMDQTNVYDYFWPMDRHQKDYKIFAEGVLNGLGCEYFFDL